MKKSPQNVAARETHEALMLVKRDGTICGSTAMAAHWLHEHFRVGKDAKRLPLGLRRWLADPNRKPGRCKPFEKENDHARLVVSLLRDETDDRFALLFEKHNFERRRTRIRHHGVTAREEQVLTMLAVGKTTNDIATALRVHPSTIKRHVEHIFSKYNVRTRAAAVAVWHHRRDKLPHDN